MSSPREETVRALQALAKAVVEEMGGTYDESVGIRVNWGEHEDRTKGFNDGFDAADPTISQPSTPELNAPPEEPWRSAYISGYQDGWQCRVEQESGVYDLPEWACAECFGTGMVDSFGPIDYHDGKTGELKHSDGAFITSMCPDCGGSGRLPVPPTSADGEGREEAS